MTKIELRENTKRGGGQPNDWLQTQYTFAVPPCVTIIVIYTTTAKFVADNISQMAMSPSGVCELSTKTGSGSTMVSAFTLIRNSKYSLTWFGDNSNSERDLIGRTRPVPPTGLTMLRSLDSMDNVEILKRGDVQLTSAGTGIRHSEVCNGNEDAHFVQIWALPWKASLAPKYYTR